MEPLVFKGTERPITPVDLQAVEQQYSFTLPDDYKAHLLRSNGGWPVRDTFFQPDPEGKGQVVKRSVNSFYAVRYGDDTLEESMESLRSDLHPDLVPFADDAGGDQFVLSVGSQDYGSIYYISHEFYTPPEGEYNEDTDEYTSPAPLDYGSGVNFLAPSFTAFL
ncbi:MAG: SMI1/KNR4 family protein, partial [Hymenobacter sp.]